MTEREAIKQVREEKKCRRDRILPERDISITPWKSSRVLIIP
jgi:hypothetical protein